MTRVAQCEQRDDFVDQLAHGNFSCSRVIASATKAPRPANARV
jgi:hypothetical protein